MSAPYPYVGQRVVCIADGDWSASEKIGVNHPEKDHVYTVRSIMTDSDGTKGIRLFEVRNEERWLSDREDYGEVAFSIDEFRPYSMKETDISSLMAISNSSKVQ